MSASGRVSRTRPVPRAVRSVRKQGMLGSVFAIRQGGLIRRHIPSLVPVHGSAFSDSEPFDGTRGLVRGVYRAVGLLPVALPVVSAVRAVLVGNVDYPGNVASEFAHVAELRVARR
jgi:hypothetical protein